MALPFSKDEIMKMLHGEVDQKLKKKLELNDEINKSRFGIEKSRFGKSDIDLKEADANIPNDSKKKHSNKFSFLSLYLFLVK